MTIVDSEPREGSGQLGDDAYRADFVDVNHDDSPGARLAYGRRQELFVLWCTIFIDGSFVNISALHSKYPPCDWHSPFPNNLAIRGRPSNALNKIVILPFSRRWAIVSFPIEIQAQPVHISYHEQVPAREPHSPLPVKSSYHTLRESTTWKEPSSPLGETLTWPSLFRGAVDTQNICCLRIHVMRFSGISSKNWPIVCSYRRQIPGMSQSGGWWRPTRVVAVRGA